MEKNTIAIATAAVVIVLAIVFGPLLTDRMINPTSYESDLERAQRLIKSETERMKMEIEAMRD